MVNVSQVLTIDRALHLDEHVAGELPMPLLERVDAGLALVLGLGRRLQPRIRGCTCWYPSRTRAVAERELPLAIQDQVS